VRARGSIGRKAIVGLGLAGLVAVAAFVGLNPDVIGLAPASADEQIMESDVVSVGGVTADRHAVVPDDATETDPVRLLGAVNEARIDHALPFESRHKVLDQLRALGRIHQVDDRLNLGLDLLQAEQSPTPCATFDAALAEILRLDDEYFDALLERVTVPQGDEAACRGLQEKFEQHTGDGEPQAEATAAPRRSKKASRRRASSSKPKQTSTASTSYDRLPTKPPPAATQDHAAEKKAPALEKLDSDVRPLQ
jgi:hypothetical protein